MPRVSGPSEVADDVIGMPVDGHAGEEEEYADKELRGYQPVRGIESIGGEVEEPFALHISVQEIEDYAHQHDGKGHAALAFQQ